MFSLSIVLRNRCLRSSTPLQLFFSDRKYEPDSSSSSSSSDSSDSSDDEREASKSPAKNQDALKRLNFLLQNMVKQDTRPPSSKVYTKTPLPKVHIRKVAELKEAEDAKSKMKESGDVLADAAKDVAESLGGNVEQTESELLSKLRSRSAVSEKGDQDVPKPSVNWSELIVGMKIDRTPKAPMDADLGRAEQVRRIMSSQGRLLRGARELPIKSARERPAYKRPDVPVSKVDLFGAPPLGIFSLPSESKSTEKPSPPELLVWKRLQERELKLATTHPPSNIYEEMIQWTESGKIWKFPIDNEQGLEEEAKVYFTEHVFLEHLLEPWCPKQGPIRHFMELVCVGLSKNPFITIQDKHEHIEWFRKYFESKQKLLKQVGALGNVPESSEEKSIEAK